MEAAIVDEGPVCTYFLSPAGNVLRNESAVVAEFTRALPKASGDG